MYPWITIICCTNHERQYVREAVVTDSIHQPIAPAPITIPPITGPRIIPVMYVSLYCVKNSLNVIAGLGAVDYLVY